MMLIVKTRHRSWTYHNDMCQRSTSFSSPSQHWTHFCCSSVITRASKSSWGTQKIQLFNIIKKKEPIIRCLGHVFMESCYTGNWNPRTDFEDKFSGWKQKKHDAILVLITEFILKCMKGAQTCWCTAVVHKNTIIGHLNVLKRLSMLRYVNIPLTSDNSSSDGDGKQASVWCHLTDTKAIRSCLEMEAFALCQIYHVSGL